MNEKVFGIDFGTTNTVVFSALGDELKNVTINGEDIIPSTVNYEIDNLFQLGNYNENSIFSIKRFLGGDQKFNSRTAQDIYNDIFQFIKNEITKTTLINEPKVVLTVPAYFNDIQRNIMKFSALNAGFKVLKILHEPTAAIFGNNLKNEGTYGIYDFGGGTFDFSVIEYKHGVFKVLQTLGNLNLGGDNIDSEIILYLKEKHNINLNNRLFFKNKLLIEKLKSSIFDNSNDSVNFEYFAKDQQKENVLLKIEDIKKIIEKYIQKTIDIIKPPSIFNQKLQFENIILVGGSSKFGIISSMLSNALNIKKEKIITKKPDTIVAIGAARYANFIVNEKSKSLIDVTPLTLGIEVSGGFIDPIINKNSKIPIEKTEIYTKENNTQKNIKIHILQGEREIAEKCTSLGHIILSNLPYGKPKIYVKFKIDIDGILSVNAWTENNNQELTINPNFNLDKKTVEAILVRDSLDGKNDIKDRLLYTAQKRAKNLLEYFEMFQKNNPEYIDEKTMLQINEIIKKIEQSFEVFDQLVPLSENLEKICKNFAEKNIKDNIIKSLKS